MTLNEFLATASADHAQALAEARAFTVNAGQLIPATTINQLFAQLDLTGVIAAGTYDVQVTSQWLNAELAVDDAYGVIA